MPANTYGKWSIATATAILAVFAALCVSSAFSYSPTYDEPKFLVVGERLASHQAWGEKMVTDHASGSFKDYHVLDRAGDFVHAPLSFYTHGILLKPFKFETEGDRLHWARVTMLVYALGMGALIFFWSSRLFGEWGGILSLSLYCFNSNILGHSSLIGTDIIFACFSLFLLYFFWRYLMEGRKRWLVASGASLGLALLSKYSAALWFFLLPAILLTLRLVEFSKERKSPSAKFLIRALTRFVFEMAVVFLVADFVLNVGYGFKGSFMPVGANHYQSHLLASLSRNSLTSWIPIPLPYPFMMGFESQKYISEIGHPSFLAGMHSTKGWWYYYFACFLLKMPAMFWLIAVLACIGMLRDRDRSRRVAECILIFSSLAIVFANSFLSNSQAGFRYVLTSVPPLFVLAGAAVMKASSLWKKGALAGLVGLYALPALLVHPHHLAYFSELVGGPKNGYKWLSDSNLDWGQDLELARQYVRNSSVPITVNPGMMPAPGRILISATTLQDCFSAYPIHEWLRPFKPVDYVGYSWLVFDVNEESVKARPRGSASLPDEYYFGAFEYARDHLQRAERFAKSALALNPDLPEAFHLLGLSEMGLGKLNEAAEAFSSVPVTHPFYVDARANLSFIASIEGKAEESKSFWKQSILEESLRSYAKRPLLDISAYSELLNAKPRSWKLQNNLGVSLWAHGMPVEAEKHIRLALDFQPDLVEAWSNLAIILEEQKRYDDALDAVDKYNSGLYLVETMPYRDYRVYYQDTRVMLGDTLEIYPKADRNVLVLESQSSRNPNDISALNQLAVALMRMGRFGEAYEKLSRAIAVNPANSGLYTNLAVLYTQKKMFLQALDTCERARSLDPHNSSAADLLASIHEKLTDSGNEESGNRGSE